MSKWATLTPRSARVVIRAETVAEACVDTRWKRPVPAAEVGVQLIGGRRWRRSNWVMTSLFAT